MDFIQINHAHDLFFRESLEHRDIAIGAAICTLPEKISAQIDFDSIEMVNDVWVDSALSIHYADILYRARLKRGKRWVTPGDF